MNENHFSNKGFQTAAAYPDDKIDFFISHASEDKELFVRELANSLLLSGASVFYDEYSMKLGDSLTEKINEGIDSSKAGIIILSKFFFEKQWTNAELQAIFSRAMAIKYKLLIIYHEITHNDVIRKYPLLADRIAIQSTIGLEIILQKIFEAVDFKPSVIFAKMPLDRGSSKYDGGFHLFVRFALSTLINPKVPKVICEIGAPHVYHSRSRFVIKNNNRLFFETTSANHQSISISCDISNWQVDEAHTIVGVHDIASKNFSLFVDGILSDAFKYETFDFPPTINQQGSLMTGCSLEMDFPCSMVVTGVIMGAPLSYQNVKDLTSRYNLLNESIGRK